MTAARRTWVLAIGAWAFLAFWLCLFTGSMFAGACLKPELSPEQRLFRCGWAWTLTTPARLLGDPPGRYAGGQMEIGIALAETGDPDAAAVAFAHALRLAGLTLPVEPERDLRPVPSGANDAARGLYRRALDLAQDHPARVLFLEVASGAGP
ncbi:MAG: hypothetical protein KBF78_01090 [Fuscovulum sp.]|nr:hypothetical protein [Fuscovulum sp.]